MIIARYKYYYLQVTEGKNGIDAKWILASIFFLPGLFLIAWLFINIQGKELQISSLQVGIFEFVNIMFLSFSMNLILGGPMGEEFGWRGFVLPLLLKKI